MAKGEKKRQAEAKPETTERNRLKKLAMSNNILTSAPASTEAALHVSKLVAKHHGRDILKKSQRKNKFLLSFPALLAPLSGGQIGELKDLGTQTPLLYLHFPQGNIKLFGTIIFPKNRYLTLQFSRAAKNVLCEDNFDAMIVFSEAWWIGNKDDNPDEVRLQFPKEMNVAPQGQHTDYDFKGGAAAAPCGRKQTMKQTATENIAQRISKTQLHNDLSDTSNDLEDQIMLTPSRHSARTAGKSYKFAEASSGDDSVEDITETFEGKKEIADPGYLKTKYTHGKTDEADPISHDMDNTDAVVQTSISRIQQSATSVKKSKDVSNNNRSSLVQATISTLFKKVEEKKVPSKKQDSSSKESGKSLQQKGSKRKSDEVKVQSPSKKKKATEEKKTVTKGTARKKKLEDEDDIEEFSSSSKDDTIGSDSDWTA